MSPLLQIVLGAAATLIVGALSGLTAWMFSMSSRVAVLEADRTSLKELISSKFEEINRRLDDYFHFKRKYNIED